MKYIYVLITLILSCDGYSQTLPSGEESKIYNTIRRIKSYVQPWETVKITTIKTDSSKQVRILCSSSTTNVAEPLLIVDGTVKEMSCLKYIKPTDIKSVNILKNEAAIKKYGKQAKNGVIEVELKHLENMPV